MEQDKDMDDIDAQKAEDSGEEYDENADEDFNPDKAEADNEDSSSEEDDAEVEEVAKGKKKKKTPAKRKPEAAEDGDLDSGDEATIKERKSKRRKKDAGAEEDSGGEGGFIRTRAQRTAEKEERRNRKKGVREGAVTIDVDKIWADLSSIPIGRTVVAPPKTDKDEMEIDNDDKENALGSAKQMVKIKREVKYAGAVRTIEEEVLRNSKEAREYFAAHPEEDPDRKPENEEAALVNRPMRRPSMFEPNPTGLIKGVPPEKLRLRAPSRLDVQMAQKREEQKKNAQKMSTVQMSQHDWKFYRKQEGLEEELAHYEKSGNRFLDREIFMDRVARAKEQAARDARMRL